MSEVPRTLAELIDQLPDGQVIATHGAADTPISGIAQDSRAVRRGDLFVCVEGATVDGHRFAPVAAAAGAVALIVGRRLDVDLPQVEVSDPRAVVGPAAAALAAHPSRSVRVTGITGTNGKTTTAQLLGAILRASGASVEVHGTLSGARTTPEATEVQRRLADARDAGIAHVVMEVSSHALALHRVDGTRFALGVFTNLGHDHLDLHGSVAQYFRAKARLFTPELTDRAVVNGDDRYGRLLADAASVPTQMFSADQATELRIGLSAHEFDWRGHHVEVPLGGRVNLPNALAALTAAVELGVPESVAAAGIASCPVLPGRFEVVRSDAPISVVVDYAHTPEGLETVLRAAREVTAGRVIAVFGCGGERDREKRPEMGRTAAALADLVVITSDNPRHEEPGAIIEEIAAGVAPEDRDRVSTLVDRASAIRRAIGTAELADTIVIAGKGHETTQTIGGREQLFDDREVALDCLRERFGS